jgi:hypothetical protein
VTVLCGGFAVGRVITIALDGLPVPLYFGVLALELAIAVLALASRRQEAGVSGN